MKISKEKLKEIIREEIQRLNEDKSLAYFQHIGYDIFDSIQKLDKEMKKHSVAKNLERLKR